MAPDPPNSNPPARLQFSLSPPGLGSTGSAFPVSVEVLDLGGRLVSDAQGTMTLSVTGNQCAATVSGASATVVGGRATFPAVSLGEAGFGFALTATFESVTGASDRFTLFSEGMWESGSWAPASPLTIGRVRPKLVPLADGTILVVGGESGVAPTAEVFDPTASRFVEMAVLDNQHVPTSTATTLADGSILFVGGRDGDLADLYLPDSQEFVPLPAPGASRFGHSATLLPDGRVALIGGQSVGTGESHGLVEYFDPDTRTFLPGPSLPSQRTGHGAALLSGGRVLVAGGSTTTSGIGTPLTSAVILDTSAGSYSHLPDSQNAYTQALSLADGRILMLGAFLADQAEVFDGQAFSAPIQAAARHVAGTMTLLPDGSVLAVGGWGGGFNPTHTDAAELFDPRDDVFRSVAPVGDARINHGAALLRDGRVLIAGGSAFDDSAYIFTPPTCFP